MINGSPMEILSHTHIKLLYVIYNVSNSRPKTKENVNRTVKKTGANLFLLSSSESIELIHVICSN